LKKEKKGFESTQRIKRRKKVKKCVWETLESPGGGPYARGKRYAS